MRKSMTRQSCPSRSRHAAMVIGPSGSTKVSISRPRMPPIGGFRKATRTGSLRSWSWGGSIDFRGAVWLASPAIAAEWC